MTEPSSQPFVATAEAGLTAAEVQQRVSAGKTNQSTERSSRSLSQIIRANVLTPFNAILGALLAVVLAVGSWKDGLFGFVLVINVLIGTVQEVRAKRTLDKLAVLSAAPARVVRDGTTAEIPLVDVVLDDIVELRSGDQVPADGQVCKADGLEIDESLLTGESDAMPKNEGDEVLSGSIVVAGSGRFQATRVGDASYAHKLAVEARRFTQTKSELMTGINTMLRYIAWAVILVGPVLFWSQTRTGESTKEALTSAVAGLVGMVPEGLVLLTSMAFLLAALTLARRKVLVQELPAVEGLARVDVLCLDKTGTLTEGEIAFADLDELEGAPADLNDALAALAADPTPNATATALAAKYPTAPAGWQRETSVAFSSARKWSGAAFSGHGCWIMGAPEMVLDAQRDHDTLERAGALADTGSRVLVVATTSAPLQGETLPADLAPVALLSFRERIRADAADTLRYFAEQGVTLKVISGDNPRTVGAVAATVGLEGADRIVDARTLPEDPNELAEVVDASNVFGRVTPQQKRAMVQALQSRGHVVAMTGDGVNDALALKDADIGVAMGSGTAATRSVAQIVLLDNQFATLPGVVAEGRRVMANIERVASLFLVKNVYSTSLALAVAVARVPFPFLPRHLTIVSNLTIGIPAFFLALAPSKRRYEPGFVKRVLRFAVPSGAVAAIAILVGYGIARAENVKGDEARATATVIVTVVGLWIVVLLARPLNRWKLALVVTMAVFFAGSLAIPFFRDFYALRLPLWALAEGLGVGAGAAALLSVGWRIAGYGRPEPTEPDDEHPPAHEGERSVQAHVGG